MATDVESTGSLQRDGSKGGKAPQSIWKIKVRVRCSVCKKCGSDHPGVDCHGKPVECFACGKKGHRSFECRAKKRTSVDTKPVGSVGPWSGRKSRSGCNNGLSGDSIQDLCTKLGPRQGKIRSREADASGNR
ncbi:PREDICTED: uncharacterized protein LOC109178445 [Ipomoea nil]|uniref:uncharacterized protein LOC109178445 n=1 Tax=Ipomoea nil TaxID=35883 RepID=UPI0009010A45|nr:PREDICTED: uncharacterized protein LOC109178445 [Ipomoea nil]